MRSLITALLTTALLLPCVASAQSTPATPQDAPAPSGTGAAQPAAATQAAQTHREERDALEPAVDTSATPPADSSATAGARTPAHEGAKSGKAMDHLELGTTDITGNRELPKVLYIVPWKRSDLGDVTGKPLNSLVDETLQPIDRDVFKRENRYYGAVAQKASASGNSGTGSAADADRNGKGAQRPSAGDER
jgi:hypothetical protein